MGLYRYDVTWLIPARPNKSIEVAAGASVEEMVRARDRETFREELISCMAPNTLDAVTQTQYQAEASFMETYGPSTERRPYVKTCWCRGEATATVYHYSPEGEADAPDAAEVVRLRRELLFYQTSLSEGGFKPAVMGELRELRQMRDDVEQALDEAERAGGDAPHRRVKPADRVRVMAGIITKEPRP
jgi:hypothetical protein